MSNPTNSAAPTPAKGPSKTRSLKRMAFFSALFVGLVIAIFVIAAKGIVTIQFAALMLVALIGLYVGFGVLMAVYRFVGRLD